MTKTIDKKVSEERKNIDIIRKVSRLMPKVTPDLSNKEVCDEFARKYGEAIAPELKHIDYLRKQSRGQMFRVVRGGYYNN